MYVEGNRKSKNHKQTEEKKANNKLIKSTNIQTNTLDLTGNYLEAMATVFVLDLKNNLHHLKFLPFRQFLPHPASPCLLFILGTASTPEPVNIWGLRSSLWFRRSDSDLEPNLFSDLWTGSIVYFMYEMPNRSLYEQTHNWEWRRWRKMEPDSMQNVFLPQTRIDRWWVVKTEIDI